MGQQKKSDAGGRAHRLPMLATVSQLQDFIDSPDQGKVGNVSDEAKLKQLKFNYLSVSVVPLAMFTMVLPYHD